MSTWIGVIRPPSHVTPEPLPLKGGGDFEPDVGLGDVRVPCSASQLQTTPGERIVRRQQVNG